jgi:SAM-dependent methyltransferase
MASRRSEKIDQHVSWIHNELLGGRSSRILDLGCGPGLYCSRLARLGHECVGIDFSPASIAYARKTALAEGLSVTYHQHDIRTADFGSDYELAMLIFGEFNIFRPEHAQQILNKVHGALAVRGTLLLEPHTFDAVRGMGQQPHTWYSSQSGVFSDEPHICMEASYWDRGAGATTIRYWVVDPKSGDVTRYAQSMQAYSEAEYESVLAESGFGNAVFYPSLMGGHDKSQPALCVVVGHKL